MKKVVIKLGIHDNKEKRKALKAVSTLAGVESIAMDMKDKKLTVIGAVDPIQVVGKLRKSWHAEILTVGPKEEEKDDGKKKEDDKKKNSKQQTDDLVKFYKAYNPYMTQHYHAYSSAEENPNSCTIC